MEDGVVVPAASGRGSSTCSSRGDKGKQQQQQRSPAPFLWKTFDMVSNERAQGGGGRMVSWNEEGNGFVVWMPEQFSQLLLPKYFKHSNFSSFIRQLNTYGFRKIASDRWEFGHEKFQRGRKHLLVEIDRRKCLPSIFPAFLKPSSERSPPPIETDEEALIIIDENRTLKRENSELLSEIAYFKDLERRLVASLFEYVGSCPSVPDVGEGKVLQIRNFIT